MYVHEGPLDAGQRRAFQRALRAIPAVRRLRRQRAWAAASHWLVGLAGMLVLALAFDDRAVALVAATGAVLFFVLGAGQVVPMLRPGRRSMAAMAGSDARVEIGPEGVAVSGVGVTRSTWTCYAPPVAGEGLLVVAAVGGEVAVAVPVQDPARAVDQVRAWQQAVA